MKDICSKTSTVAARKRLKALRQANPDIEVKRGRKPRLLVPGNTPLINLRSGYIYLTSLECDSSGLGPAGITAPTSTHLRRIMALPQAMQSSPICSNANIRTNLQQPIKHSIQKPGSHITQSSPIRTAHAKINSRPAKPLAQQAHNEENTKPVPTHKQIKSVPQIDKHVNYTPTQQGQAVQQRVCSLYDIPPYSLPSQKPTRKTKTNSQPFDWQAFHEPSILEDAASKNFAKLVDKIHIQHPQVAENLAAEDA